MINPRDFIREHAPRTVKNVERVGSGSFATLITYQISTAVDI